MATRGAVELNGEVVHRWVTEGQEGSVTDWQEVKLFKK